MDMAAGLFVLGGAIGLSSVATTALAWLTAQNIREQRNWSALSVLPHPQPHEESGYWLYPKGQIPANQKQRKLKPLEIQNSGNGPALALQWETGPVLVIDTYVERLDIAEKKPLWCAAGIESKAHELAEGARITFWCDDLLGNHYRHVYVRQDEHWVKVYGRREARRPFQPAAGMFPTDGEPPWWKFWR